MKKEKNNLKEIIIILLVTFILAILSMINFSVAKYANNEKSIEIKLNKGDIVKSIIISSNKLNLSTYQNENLNLIESNENNEESELLATKDTILNLNISVIDSLSVNLDKLNNIDSENIDIFPSKLEIIKRSININSIIIFIISYIVLFIAVYAIRKLLKVIQEDKLKLIDILLLLIAIFVIYLSNIYLFMMINKILAIIPAIILSIYILFYFNFSIKEWKNIFLLISAVIGTMMIFIITLGNVPDESSHFIRGYADSIIDFNEEKNDLKLPEDINRFFNKFTHSVHSLDVKYSGTSYMTELANSTDYTKLSENISNYNNTKYLSFLPYISSAIVNLFARYLNLPILITFLLCRLSNLIISTVICYLAIKITPRFKKVFAILAIFPVFLQQAMGINMDYLTNSISFLYIAVIFKYRFEDTKLDIKKLVYIAILAILLALCKFGYFPILLLILLIPNKNFKNKKIAIAFKVALILIPIIISYFANFTAVSNPNENTDMYTISTVLSNPINSAKICLKTFLLRFEADTFSRLIDGFGWSTKYHIGIILWTIGAITIIILFSDNEDSKVLKIKDRIIMLGVWAIIYLILYGVAFTEWTSINLDRINGLQARYFIPILPLFYIIISNTFITLNIKNKWKFYTILLFIAEILSNISILIAFY